MHQVSEHDPIAYGGTDLWEFDLMEVGRELPCGNARTFLHYLCSEGTGKVSIRSYSTSDGTARVNLRGPRADDGRFLTVSYVLSRDEVHGKRGVPTGLEGWEQRLLSERVEGLNPTGQEPWLLARKALAEVLHMPYAA